MGAVHYAHRWKGRLRSLNGTLRGVSALEGAGIGKEGCVQGFYQTSAYQGLANLQGKCYALPTSMDISGCGVLLCGL